MQNQQLSNGAMKSDSIRQYKKNSDNNKTKEDNSKAYRFLNVNSCVVKTPVRQELKPSTHGFFAVTVKDIVMKPSSLNVIFMSHI
jgi:hypothetical protein